MRQQFRAVVAIAALAVLATGADGAFAQAAQWNSFATVSPIFQGDADLDRGGEVSSSGVVVRLGTSTDFGGGTRGGITLNYDYADYSFTNPVAFGGVAPWGIVQRYGVALPFTFRAGDGWVLGVAPSADWFRENGAQTSDALAWGATFSAIRVFPDGNRIGVGIGAFDQIEDTSVFPFLIIDWRLDDHWRIVNPLPSGPTGGAGLELDYRFDSGWRLGVGASFRQLRFRLDQNGPVPNGIGEERGVPVFLRASVDLHPQVTLRAYAGVVTGRSLRVEDPSGNRLSEDDSDTSPLFALALQGRF